MAYHSWSCFLKVPWFERERYISLKYSTLKIQSRSCMDHWSYEYFQIYLLYLLNRSWHIFYCYPWLFCPAHGNWCYACRIITLKHLSDADHFLLVHVWIIIYPFGLMLLSVNDRFLDCMDGKNWSSGIVQWILPSRDTKYRPEGIMVEMLRILKQCWSKYQSI